MKIWNSFTTTTQSVGGTLPLLAAPCSKRMHGAVVSNDLAIGERIAGGTPMYFNIADRTVKFLKAWKVKTVTANAVAGTTDIVLVKNHISPVLKAGMVIMAMPSAIAGTGKAVVCGTVTEAEYTYTITVTTADFDKVEAGDYIVESSSAIAGSGKAIYCQPNSISIEDTVGGDVTLVDIPRGVLYMYKNTIPDCPDAVITNIQNGGDIHIVWEMFNEITS